ncbi:hypothetical protein MRB53_010766 [Persea americana]|uniref:Uncharacterized protein n=1 Tax=Persea americana TaxID=3435 RepID=A0ACC2LSW7_PERAE|nr:hypothetical protein MRB53_010766 [Persea americana]
MGNPWTTRFDSSSSSSSSTRPSSPGDEKKEEDGTKRKKKSNFLMDPATDHNHSLSAFGRHLATMGTRGEEVNVQLYPLYTRLTSIKERKIYERTRSN